MNLQRRAFISVLGGAAWPIVARGQATPVIGILSAGSPESDASRLSALRQGLNDMGYVAGRHVTIEYRGMQAHYDLLPALLADFIHRPVSLILSASSTPAALAAKAATSTIPILFNIGADPIDSGLVVSLHHPGGNVTGIFNLSGSLAAKRLEMLRESVPKIGVVAALANPSNSFYNEYETNEVRNAAGSLGLQLHILNASSVNEIDAAFARLAQLGAGALMVSSDSFLVSRREQIVELAARHGLPTMCGSTEFTTAGGLIAYGIDTEESYRQTGMYAGRILKGEKPTDLPVMQATKVQLTLNLKTAKALGLTFPLTLLVRADEVIE